MAEANPLSSSKGPVTAIAVVDFDENSVHSNSMVTEQQQHQKHQHSIHLPNVLLDYVFKNQQHN